MSHQQLSALLSESHNISHKHNRQYVDPGGGGGVASREKGEEFQGITAGIGKGGEPRQRRRPGRRPQQLADDPPERTLSWFLRNTSGALGRLDPGHPIIQCDTRRCRVRVRVCVGGGGKASPAVEPISAPSHASAWPRAAAGPRAIPRATG